MINLLPLDNKKQLRASIHNRILSQYIFLLITLLLISLGAFVFVYFSLKQSQNIFQAQEIENNKRIIKYDAMKKSASELSVNINQTKNVLSGRVDYSKVLFKLAKILPEGISVGEIKLESKLFEGEKKLNINIERPDQASEVKKIFEQSKLFKSVSILNVTNSEKSRRVTFMVVFDKKGFDLWVKTTTINQ